MVLVEAVNIVHIRSAAGSHPSFPKGYVSQGVYTLPVFVMRPRPHSGDSFPAITAARKAAVRNGDLYTDFQAVGSSFIYPPTAAIELLPLGVLGNRAGDAAATEALDVIGRLAVLATVLLSARLLGGALGTPLGWAATLAVLLAFYPLRWMVRLVQVQSLITVLLAAALFLYGRRRGVWCGVAIGLASGLKPHYGALVIFALVRKEWRVALWGAATALALMLASVAWLGLEPWRAYAMTVLPAISTGYGYFPNQSINGLLHRWVGHSTAFELPPPSPTVSTLTLIASALLFVVAIVPRLRPATPGGVPRPGFEVVEDDRLRRSIDIGIAMLAFTLASPIVWDHHYAWTVALFAACAAWGARHASSPAFWVALCGGYVLLGTYIVPFEFAGPGPRSLFNALPLLGAVILLLAAWRAASAAAPGSVARG
jgi:hypothetical protein